MIRLIDKNGENMEYLLRNFPDKTINIKFSIEDYSKVAQVVWKYEGDEELVQIMFIAKHIKDNISSEDKMPELLMPYVPNARMDRVADSSELFTLKHFADIINSLGFMKVVALDVHSPASKKLINKIEVLSPREYIERAIKMAGVDTENDYIFFPDKGSRDRYREYVSEFKNVGFGVKQRVNGTILGLELSEDSESPEGKNVFIIDDICAKGGTVKRSADLLKSLGCKDISVYFSHTEDTIAKGELLKGDLIKGIYTTNSLITLTAEDSDKLHIMDCFKLNDNDERENERIRTLTGKVNDREEK